MLLLWVNFSNIGSPTSRLSKNAALLATFLHTGMDLNLFWVNVVLYSVYLKCTGHRYGGRRVGPVHRRVKVAMTAWLVLIHKIITC